MLVFYMDKLHDPAYNSAPTKTAQSSCFQLDFYSQAWTPFFENGTTLSRHNMIASFSDICTYSMSDVGGGRGDAYRRLKLEWHFKARLQCCGSGFIGPSAAKPSTSENVTPYMPQQWSDTRTHGWSSCVFYCTTGVWSKCTFLLTEPQSSVISETTHQILTFSN